jgi:hypothetical protein
VEGGEEVDMSRWGVPIVIAVGTILILTSLREIEGPEHLPQEDYFPNPPHQAIVTVPSTATAVSFGSGAATILLI